MLYKFLGSKEPDRFSLLQLSDPTNSWLTKGHERIVSLMRDWHCEAPEWFLFDILGANFLDRVLAM